MFLNFGIVFNAVLLVLGLIWCREMLGRWRRDLDEFRSTKDASARQVLVVLWGATALILILLINFFVGMLKNIGVL
ncbi:MAG TPA: hypothetical protein VK348_08930 [Planctomycetota bacterium]|nr:hypothetical protein [Planctomycetota bacterium]